MQIHQAVSTMMVVKTTEKRCTCHMAPDTHPEFLWGVADPEAIHNAIHNLCLTLKTML